MDEPSSESIEEAVLEDMQDEIIGGMSPNEVGNLMMDRRLLQVGEFERLVIMRTKNSTDAEQNGFLLSCLKKRSTGSFQMFREILIQTGATHLEDDIQSRIKNMSTGATNNVKEYWKKKSEKLEVEMQYKEEEIRKLQSQVEDLKFKDDEIKRLRSQIENLTSCIITFQNTVKPLIVSPFLREKLGKIYHPSSQRSSWDKESPRSSWYGGREDSPSPAMINESSQLSERPQPIDEENFAESKNKISVNPVPSVALSTHHSASSLNSPSSHTTLLKTGGTSLIFRRRSPSNDPGMNWMQKRKKQIENNEMPEDIKALEQKK